MHRLRAVPGCLSSRCDPRGAAPVAYDIDRGMHRLRNLPAGVSGRLYSNLADGTGFEIVAMAAAGAWPVTALHRFPGGLRLTRRKAETEGLPIRAVPLPRQLIVPLAQHVGVAAEPVAAVGSHVLKGQLLARPSGYVSAPVHAPTSGIVREIVERPIVHPGGLSGLCLVLDTDGRDEWAPHTGIETYLDAEPGVLRELIHRAGIVGFGGAGFPTHVKLREGANQGVETLLVNGAECEPYITSDNRLLQERAAEIVAGARILARVLAAGRCVIALEEEMSAALAALRAAVGGSDVTILSVPGVYPTGGEKQLVRVVTGRAVPRGGLSIDAGVVVQNVATAAAVYRAVRYGEPVLSRIVTVAGEVAIPGNFETLLGTPVATLLELAGLPPEPEPRIICGGPMMGTELAHRDAPITKVLNCLLVQRATPHIRPRPCIRCGACDEVCPMRLQARALYDVTRVADFDQAQDLHLFDCIECGCCAYVCPSEIPLVQHYRHAKSVIEGLDRDHARAMSAALRFARHQQNRQRDRSPGDTELLDAPESRAELQAEIDAALARNRERP